MGDYDRTRHTKKRRTAIDLRIHLALERLERAKQQNRSEHADEVSAKLALHPIAHRVGHRLRGLQDHIADKTIAYDHIGATLEEIMPFHIAAELDGVDFLQKAESLLGKLVALAVLGADREQPDLRGRTV